MNIIVCVKPVPDLSNISISRGQGMVFERGKRILNPYDEHALEVAAVLKEKHGGSVTALCLSDETGIDILRRACAMVANKGCLIAGDEFKDGDHLTTARALARAIGKLGVPDIILCGARSEEHGAGQIGPRIAEELGIPQAAWTIHLECEGNQAKATQKIDGMERVLAVELPALVTVHPDANKPRMPHALAIMKSTKKEIIRFSAADLGLGAPAVGAAGSVMKANRSYLVEE